MLDSLLFCILILESYKVKNVKGRKKKIYGTRENNSAPFCVPYMWRMHEIKKKMRGKEENHRIFQDSVIVYIDEMARLSMLRQP